MNKILISGLIAIMCAPWVSQSTGECGEKKGPFDTAYALVDIPSPGMIIGISPNADSVIIGDEGSRTIGSIRLINGRLSGTMWSADMKNPGSYPYGKRAVWSEDGKYLTFRSHGVYPLELTYFRNFRVYVIESESGKIIETGDGSYEEKPKLSDMKITYDSAFIPGTESLMYHRYATTGVELNIAGIGGGKPAQFRKAGDDGAFAYAIPLSGKSALVYVEPIRNKDPIILTILSADDMDREVMRKDRSGGMMVWEMKANSSDCRTFLIQERVYEPQSSYMPVQALRILRLNDDCSDWSIDSIVGKDGLILMDSALSPDAKRTVYLERKNGAKGEQSAVLCRVREGGSDRLLFEEKTESFADWMPGRNGEGIIYMSDRAFLLRVGDRYRLYRLK